MKKNSFVLILTSLLFWVSASNAQEKYAVLICGDYDEQQISGDWDGDEGWNDTYLMWEMLLNKGYTEEHIFVLYADGYDNQNPLLVDRYKPDQGVTVTDMACTIANITTVFTNLASGASGYPVIMEDDFLFVWTMLHGYINVCPPYGGYFPLPDGNMPDDYFAEKINLADYNKRVFWMQGNCSFMLTDELAFNGLRTVFNSAGNANEICHQADDNPVTENEEYLLNNQYIPYHHGEFDYHMWGSSNAMDPANNLFYYGEPFTNADLYYKRDKFPHELAVLS